MEKIETIHDRISQLVQAFGEGKNTVFAALIGENEANIRGYRSNILPKHPLLEKIVTSLDVSSDWLLTGRGNMIWNKEPRATNVETTTIYKSDPKDLEIIKDKMKIIALQEDKIRMLEERIVIQPAVLGSARSVDIMPDTGTQPHHK